MSRLLRSGLAVALLLFSVLNVSLAGTAEPAAAGGAHIVDLPAIFNGQGTYVLQPGSPTYLSNFINTAGCNWFGIIGRAFGRDGNPVIGLTVHLEGGGIYTDAVTGSVPSALGPGGYEIPISEYPIETTGVYFIQLHANNGAPLSAVFMIPTYGDCSKNMVMVNFTASP